MPKKKILIVDDEQNVTKFLKLALERTGYYDVMTENAGENAVDTIRSSQPNLLILDVNLPGVDGGQISAAVQADPALKGIPIIFLTGNVSDEESEAGLTISGYPAMAKPIHMERLLKCIEQQIR